MTTLGWRRGRTLALVGILALAVTSPLTAGGRPAPRKERAALEAAGNGLVGRAWIWLANVWAKEGVMINPDGLQLDPEPRVDRAVPPAPGAGEEAGSGGSRR